MLDRLNTILYFLMIITNKSTNTPLHKLVVSCQQLFTAARENQVALGENESGSTYTRILK